LTNTLKKGKLIQIVKNKWKLIMAARCELTGKGKQFGHNVSFSLRRTKRVFKPNLQKKTFMVDGQRITMILSTQAIRTLKKKGILAKAA
jgi:large subunit ribosomal protein L28